MQRNLLEELRKGMNTQASLVGLLARVGALALLLVVGGAPGNAWAGAEPGASRAAHPNLLVITFDTTRADRLGCFGYSEARTPSIDRLAKEGTTFTRAYAQSSQTLPSHVTLFTGLYPITHNVTSNGLRLSDDAVTLAEILKSHGYRTGAIVATAPLSKDFNLDQGFETYNDKLQQRPLDRAAKGLLRILSWKKINIRATLPADRVAALASRWIEKHGLGEEPFFLWIHFIEPHEPYEFHPSFDQPRVIEEDGKPNAFGHKEANYINEIEFADYYLGKVLRKLDETGLAARTLTVFAADHGESLGEHDYQGHRQEVFENIIRVPLILRLPGALPEGKRLATPAMLLDVTPTVLNLLRVPCTQSTFQGEDLLALPEDRPRKLYSLAVKLFTKSPIRTAVVYGAFKYIENEDPSKNALYRIADDPQEEANLLSSDAPDRGALDWPAEVRLWRGQYEKLSFSDFTLSQEQLKNLESLGYTQ